MTSSPTFWPCPSTMALVASVVETDALTFLRLATGDLTWAQAVAGAVRISGVHADLSDVFPFG